MSVAATLGEAFEAHRGFLWGLSYRLTGCAADADDVVQETFVRALRHPPERLDQPLRPWLARVALNLGRDVLRRRRRRAYDGPWLPSPVETAEPEPSAFEAWARDGSPGARYELMESLSMAFLLALEALTPTQRAVLLLRDVFDYTVRETAATLDLSESNVKVTHLRARRALAGYDRARRPGGAQHSARTQGALERFLACLAQGDAPGLEELLAEGVRARSDGGGEFTAARRPIVGRSNVARFLLGLAAKARAVPRVEWRRANGLPALLLSTPEPRPGWAPRVLVQCLVDDDGRISEVLTVLASRKLTALSRPAGADRSG